MNFLVLIKLLFSIQQMGSLFSKLDDKMPEIYSYAEYEKLVNEINQISIQISKQSNFILTVNIHSLRFDYSSWKNSLVKATLGLFPQQVLAKRLHEAQEQMEKQPEYSYKQTFDLTLSMRQLYNILDLLRFFKKQKIPQRSTLTQTPLTQEGRNCQICFDQIADSALPCGVSFQVTQHIFGAKCISKYIIDKEQKSCPMCRRKIIGGRSTIQRNLYIVIDEDESIYDELRLCLFDILKDKNENSINSASAALADKGKPAV